MVIAATDTIDTIKTKIHDLEGIQLEDQHLFSEGQYKAIKMAELAETGQGPSDLGIAPQGTPAAN